MITGAGFNTNPHDVVWFCHLCNASFVLPVGRYHQCSPAPSAPPDSAAFREKLVSGEGDNA